MQSRIRGVVYSRFMLNLSNPGVQMNREIVTTLGDIKEWSVLIDDHFVGSSRFNIFV